MPTRSLGPITTRSFSDLGVGSGLVAALDQAGITKPFAVQELTIADALAGRDIAGKAPTGSGKTLAFGIPIIERIQRSLAHRPRALVLAPTRELAKQICDALLPLAKSRHLRVDAFYGGTAFEPQISALERGVDIAVACPGRLLDLIGQGLISLADVEIAVIDEADRLADMGFLPDVVELLGLTRPDRQTMLFSATLDGDVDVLVTEHQRDPVRHEVVAPEEGPILHLFWQVHEAIRLSLLVEVIDRVGSCIVFARTRHGAERIAVRLQEAGIPAASLHGGNSQLKRETALEDFRRGELAALVATDVAARGIHIDAVPCVVQYDLPADPKDYLHRAGRTGRAGDVGTVVSFVPVAFEPLAQRIIEQLDLDVDLEPSDVRQLATPDERAALDRAIAELSAIRRPGEVGAVAYAVRR